MIYIKKLSNYNLTLKDKDNLIIYNTMSSGILTLDSNYVEHYNNAIKSNDFNLLPTELHDNLLKGHMLIDSDIDEISYLKVLNNTYRYQNNKLVLTIAPTLNCNFACPYCYENGRRYKSMDSEIEDRLIEFIKTNMVERKYLTIAWYGGEPLLNIKSIESISKNVIKENYNYSAAMVTNGYLLDKQMALKLRDLKVKYIQITLDGPPEIHNKRRFLLNGEGTFERIIKNIAQACEVIPIRIRVNVDNNNYECINKLFDYLDKYKLQGKVNVYISPVHNVNGNCHTSECMTNDEFSEAQITYLQKYNNRGYFNVSVPRCNASLCSAVNSSAFTVDPSGNLYKCWNDIGNTDEIVGSIYKGTSSNKTHIKWLEYSPFNNNKCKKCDILPICMGGCPDFQIKTKEENCHFLKKNREVFVKLIYEQRNAIGFFRDDKKT